jgi:Leucine-rich repeat (LRR) protein|tara:strand:- start:67 stop:222 length:156 start_codon:yes stop_codon:yes gene_type:complete
MIANEITDVSPLASLTNLTTLWLKRNPLNQESFDVHVPNFIARGVSVYLLQ